MTTNITYRLYLRDTVLCKLCTFHILIIYIPCVHDYLINRVNTHFVWNTCGWISKSTSYKPHIHFDSFFIRFVFEITERMCSRFHVMIGGEENVIILLLINMRPFIT